MAINRIVELATAIPEVWASEALQKLKSYCTMAKLVNRDYEPDIAVSGSVISINSIPTLTASTLVDGNDVNFQAASTSRVQLTLKHIESSFSITNLAEALAKPDVMAGYLNSSVVAIAETIETDLLSEYVNAATQVGSAGVAVTLPTVSAARKALVDNKVPILAPKWLVLSTKDAKALLDNSNIKDASQYGSNAPLASGSIGRLYGADVYENQLVRTTGFSPLATHNLMGVKDAITLAMRPLGIPAAPGVSASEIDSGDGFSVRVLISWNTDALAYQVTVDVLYGIKTLRTGALLVDVLG